ncbi:helix-turn-helix domain-containing protein [Streptococcus gallolyticus]|nr:helix-turn-helix domain-containing protein [Streptococcus gallolyticus]MBY5040418.1 helix-turn-helix domain-containing protein [Streptococcus gallolyticus]
MTDKELAIYIGNKIKEYRKAKSFTQKELAEKVGMGDTTIANYEKGFRTPKKNTLFKLANAFDISIDDLFPPIDKIVEKSTHTPSPSILKLDKDLKAPRHGQWVQYGHELLEEQKREKTAENSKNTVEIHEEQLFPYNYYDQPASAGTGQYLNDVQVKQVELPINVNADFVVPIYGDSMEPEYHSGDYVFVKLSVDLSDGDIGVFEYNGDAYIKQLLINEDGAFLHSLNSKYDDIPVDSDSDFRIIGKVVERYRKNINKN